MSLLPDIVQGGLIGLIAGFVICIPVGPVNVTIINEGAQRGFLWAVMIGFGAIVMEVIYCAVGFAGFSTLLFTSRLVKAAMELISFLLLLYLGLKYLAARSVPASNPAVAKFEEKLHPHSAFMIGFVRVLGNPIVLLFWIAVAGAFTSHEWISPGWPARGSFFAGVGLGGSLWFLLLSYIVSLRHGRFSTHTLLRMSQVSGALLLCVALILGVRIVTLLARRGG
jgi:threonine/homoserine/homoserine lactone efflux protein